MTDRAKIDISSKKSVDIEYVYSHELIHGLHDLYGIKDRSETFSIFYDQNRNLIMQNPQTFNLNVTNNSNINTIMNEIDSHYQNNYTNEIYQKYLIMVKPALEEEVKQILTQTNLTSIPDGKTGTINYRIPGLANNESEELNTVGIPYNKTPEDPKIKNKEIYKPTQNAIEKENLAPERGAY